MPLESCRLCEEVRACKGMDGLHFTRRLLPCYLKPSMGVMWGLILLTKILILISFLQPWYGVPYVDVDRICVMMLLHHSSYKYHPKASFYFITLNSLMRDNIVLGSTLGFPLFMETTVCGIRQLPL